MEAQRPRSVLFTGMACSLVGGFSLAVCTLWTFLYLGGRLLLASGSGTIATRDPAREAPGYAAFEWTGLLSAWALALLLVSAGEGLVRMRRSGRRTAVWYAIGSLVREALVLVYTLAFLAQGAEADRVVRLAAGPLAVALFAAVVLFVATRPYVVEAFARIPPDDKKTQGKTAAPPSETTNNAPIRGD